MRGSWVEKVSCVGRYPFPSPSFFSLVRGSRPPALPSLQSPARSHSFNNKINSVAVFSFSPLLIKRKEPPPPKKADGLPQPTHSGCFYRTLSPPFSFADRICKTPVQEASWSVMTLKTLSDSPIARFSPSSLFFPAPSSRFVRARILKKIPSAISHLPFGV